MNDFTAQSRWLTVLSEQPRSAIHAMKPSTASLVRSSIDIFSGALPRPPK